MSSSTATHGSSRVLEAIAATQRTVEAVAHLQAGPTAEPLSRKTLTAALEALQLESAKGVAAAALFAQMLVQAWLLRCCTLLGTAGQARCLCNCCRNGVAEDSA